MMDTELAKTFTALFLGVGLSAACGFRVFVPLLFISIAARAEYVELASGWDWVGSIPAIVTFASATALEIGAYYIPWLDNLLDSIAAPAAVIAGIVVTTSMIGDMNPYLKWPLAVIAGGGSAGLVQAGTTILRAASTAATGGIGNPLVSTSEAGASVGLSLLAILLPIAAAVVVVVLLFLSVRFVYRRIRRKRHKGLTPA